MLTRPAEVSASLPLPNERATSRFAEDIAAMLRPGDVVALSGGLGAGKTTFARALIRALAADPTLDVQSPTFPLRIDHALPRMKVAHADLYRIGNASELDEIGLDEAMGEGALIVEWPELLPPDLSAERLDIAFEIEGEGRRAAIAGRGSWPERLARTAAIRRFLDAAGWRGAVRTPLIGDASYRAYESITPSGGDEVAAILMNAPARAEGPKIYDGRSYDAVAHRAMDVRAFVAIDHALKDAGVRVPGILTADIPRGILLVENLGSELVVGPTGGPILERYEAAIDLLTYMHSRSWPSEAPLPDGTRYRLPPYDREALLVETSLFPDWFGGHAGSGEPAFPKERREEFLATWSALLDQVDASSTTWTLRDFHSPNILWQERAEGIARVGVLDFQDALIGHPAYDVASLAQDTRVDLTAEDEARLKARYIAGRSKTDPNFDVAGFERAYSILGLQRATKVLGIFTRLAFAEGKPGYQRHRPRLKALIRRNLADPVLSPLRLWYEPYL